MLTYSHTSRLLKFQTVKYPLSIDYDDCYDAWDLDNKALMFDLEDIFNKPIKEKLIKQKDIYYVSYGKKHHFHIHQEITPKGFLLTVLFTFPSNIVNGLPNIFKEKKYIPELLGEDKLYKEYHEILKKHGYEWPLWDNKDKKTYSWYVKEAIEEVRVKKVPKNIPATKPEPKETPDSAERLNQISSAYRTNETLFLEKACVFIKGTDIHAWCKTKDELAYFLNHIFKPKVLIMANEIIIERPSASDYFGKDTHDIVVRNQMIGYTNKML